MRTGPVNGRHRVPLKGPDMLPPWVLRLMIIICLMLWLGGGAIITTGVVTAHQGSLYTASVEGVATQVVLYRGSGNNPSTNCEIHYQYYLDNGAYTGYDPDASAYLDHCYPEFAGSTVTVYYIPGAPEKSSLSSAHDQTVSGYGISAMSLILLGAGVFLWIWTDRWSRQSGGDGLRFSAHWARRREEAPIFVDKGTWNWPFVRLFVGIMAGIGLVPALIILIFPRQPSPDAPEPLTLAITAVGSLVGCIALGFGISALIYRPYKLRLYTQGFTWGVLSVLFIGYNTIDPGSIRAVQHIERVKKMIDKKNWATDSDTGTGKGIVFLCGYSVHYGNRGSQGLERSRSPMLWTITTHDNPLTVANRMIDVVTRFHDPNTMPVHLTSVEDLTGDPIDAPRQLPPLVS